MISRGSLPPRVGHNEVGAASAEFDAYSLAEGVSRLCGEANRVPLSSAVDQVLDVLGDVVQVEAGLVLAEDDSGQGVCVRVMELGAVG